MARDTRTLLKWTMGGVLAAIALSVLTLLLPVEWGGYNPWSDAHLALHNVAAIVVRIVVFAMIGALAGGAWHVTRRSGS